MTLREPQRSPRTYVRTGYYSAKRALLRSGLTVIDGRSPVGRQIARARVALEDHLGGADAVSVTLSRVVESVLTLDVLIDTASGALHKLGAVDRKAKALVPLARELAGLIAQRHSLCRDLGWQRAPKPTLSLAELLARSPATPVATPLATPMPAPAAPAAVGEATSPPAAAIVHPADACAAFPHEPSEPLGDDHDDNEPEAA